MSLKYAIIPDSSTFERTSQWWPKDFDNDCGLIQINIGDEIGLLIDHETKMSYN